MNRSDRKATNQSAGARQTGTQALHCPICGEAVENDAPTSPFCSSRCKTIDLGKWIAGDYKISRPVEEADLDQDD